MVLSIKLRKKGHKKLYTFSFVVIKKKKSIQGVYQQKIGDYVYLKDSNKTSIFISKEKVNIWRYKGVCLENKFLKLIKNV